MKRFVFSLFLSTMFLASFAQIYNFNLPELMIDNFDSTDFSFGAVDSNNANTFLNTMAGDTIIFKGNMVRDDFYKLDTIWLKSNVKKPVLGKHYIVNYHYKTLDNDKTTPNEFVYDRPWVILKSSIEGDGNLEMSKKNYLDLKDIETGDIVRWKYREGYRFSENVEIIDLTKSKAFHDILKKLVLFEQSGNEIFPSPEFTEISIMNVTAKIVTRDKGNSLDLLTTILLSDNVTYYFAKKKLQHTIILVNENVKNQRLNELKNKGRFFLTLTNVEKPENSKILKGKIITLPNDNILKTKYSYEDNIMIIVFDEGIEKIDFSLNNKSGSSITIEWDKASYIDFDNNVSRIFHSGIRFIDRQKSMPPSIIPNGANLNDQIRPTDNAFFDGSWHSTPLIPFYNRYDPQLVGKTIKIILPISINGIENEYSFVFSLDWIYEYPELQKE